MLYPIFELFLRSIFPKRPLSIALKMKVGTQHGYFFLNGCRHAIALTGAVTCLALPLTLFYFQKFPLLSLFYNLFFPFMVSISITLLILGALVDIFFSPLAHVIHALNNAYTNFMLSYTYNIPSSIDLVWRVPALSLELLICYLTLSFFAGIYAFSYIHRRCESLDDWAFA